MKDIEEEQMKKYTQGWTNPSQIPAQLKAEIAFEVENKVKKLRGFYGHLTAYLLVNIVVVISQLSEGEVLNLGMFNLAIWWGFGVVAHAVSVFGANLFFNEAWEQRKIEEFMRKSDRQ